jgi:hypothetical protein
VSKSTQTIFDVIESAAIRYLTTKATPPTHVFIGPFAMANLRKEFYTMANLRKEFYTMAFNHPMDDVMTTAKEASTALLRISHPEIPPLRVQLVLEEKKDFLMVCQEQEYLDYVVERTVLC